MGGKMALNVNDLVKYNFPDPGNNDKKSVTGRIAFAGETKVVIVCEDGSKLNVSVHNINNIKLLEPAEELTEAF
jgi:hypothetical protein